MRAPTVVSLAVVAAIALFHGCLSYASPTSGSTKHANSVGKPGTYTALAIHTGLSGKYKVPPYVKELFVNVIEEFPPSNGHHCLLLERLYGDTLKQFTSNLPSQRRDDLLPGIFSQLITALKYMHSIGYVHGDIKPDNIIVYKTPVNAPRVVLIDFDGSLSVGNQTMRPVTGTRGYRPPEDYLKRPADQYRRDSWMLGATLYHALVGISPYGYEYSLTNDVFNEMAKEDIAKKMVQVSKLDANIFYPTPKSGNAHLLELMNALMTCDVRYRPTVSELKPTLLYNLAPEKRVRVFLSQVLANHRSRKSNQAHHEVSANSKKTALPPTM
ncbi:kinase-like domain-containing protein [Thamnocephalis sphaerospora]|uniref:Kinase-like domain-containing protein n=1 Tax=Thamnocephalis sphaerospora TaxID=78915 RepID=A0A4P9XHH8_9FUNG|nr:kinase-like domain-containing protein [Thamnocephalis sphaerospora]|eukprot:RKP04731.1 kinase-like domain-containing protein [Thamnocephalis sphaerospora]